MISITFHYRYRKQIVISLISLTVIISLTVLGIIYYPKEKKTSSSSLSPLPKKEVISKKESSTMYKVDIKGQVISPGIYTLEESSRVIDVITAAGGLTENANTTVLNLSKKITDEMVIIVYSNEEVAEFAKTKELENTIQEKCQQKDDDALKNDACICNGNSSQDTTLISINNGNLSELMTLPGIGEAKAQDIIDYRKNNGPFQTIEDIKNVSGIGESLFAKIKDYITL